MSKFSKMQEKISVLVAKRPSEAVLLGILVFNLVFLVIASLVIFLLAPASIQEEGLPATFYYTITMVLDAGCIENVVTSATDAGVVLILVCLVVVLVSMVVFSGAIIGYVTNFISSFIERADAGKRTLYISGHTVILGWNSRSCEVIVDMLYGETDEKVVILSALPKEEIEAEVEGRIAEVVHYESKNKQAVALDGSEVGRREVKKSNVTFIVRQGDTCSTRQLEGVCISRAKTVMIMGSDSVLVDEEATRKDNTRLIKTLIQVAEMTNNEKSARLQRVIVEVENRWTRKIARQIIAQKRREGLCDFILVSSNSILGALLAQFAITPELNLVYSDIFSTRGSYFVAQDARYDATAQGEHEFVSNFLAKNHNAIPLTIMETEQGNKEFYLVNANTSIDARTKETSPNVELNLRPRSGLERRKIAIIGHNAKTYNIMMSFKSFDEEWRKLANHSPLDICVFDDAEGLEAYNNYKDWPFVNETICTSVYDDKLFEEALFSYIFKSDLPVSLLVLSDDRDTADRVDASAIARLIFVQNVLDRLLQEKPGFSREQVDLLVEVLDSQDVDVVKSYNVNSVVVSNRYVSKIMNQIGECESLLSLYTEMLTYDGGLLDGSETKEIYMKPVGTFFEKIPAECTAEALIRSVYAASTSLDGISPTIVMGYYRPGVGVRLFTGNQAKIKVALQPDDKLVLFADH